MQFAQALTLGFLGVPDAPPLIGELEPVKLCRVYRPGERAPERAIGRRARLTIGWKRRLCGGFLMALLPGTSGKRHGDEGRHQHARPSNRAGQVRS